MADTRTVQLFGQGEFPPELDRVNWGAVLTGGLWALLNGAWAWLGVFVALYFAQVAVFGLLNGSGLEGLSARTIAVSAGSYLVVWLVRGVFGIHANRAAWKRMVRMREKRSEDESMATQTVERFRESQKTWLYFGAVWVCASYAYGYWQYLEQWPDRALLPAIDLAISAAVIVGLLLWDRARLARSARPS